MVTDDCLAEYRCVKMTDSKWMSSYGIEYKTMKKDSEPMLTVV